MNDKDVLQFCLLISGHTKSISSSNMNKLILAAQKDRIRTYAGKVGIK